MTGLVTWAQALDDWEAFLDAVDAALDSGDWDERAPAGPWRPPAGVQGELGADGERRALALADRAGRLRDRLDAAMRDTAMSLGQERRKGAGMRAYARRDGLSA